MRSRAAFAVRGACGAGVVRGFRRAPEPAGDAGALISVSQQEQWLRDPEDGAAGRTKAPSGRAGSHRRLKGTPLLAAWAQERLLRQTPDRHRSIWRVLGRSSGRPDGRMRALNRVRFLHKRLKAAPGNPRDGDVAYQSPRTHQRHRTARASRASQLRSGWRPMRTSRH